MKKVLLDTNSYSALMVGNTTILSILESAHQVFMSPICLGELLAGFKQGNKEKANRNLMEQFLKKPTVHVAPLGRETSEWFAKVFTDLKQNGTPIPLNDVWIASQAQELGAELVSFDKHFQEVPGLRLWDQA
ncbi:type II toxin-antitoxin system VapC family toxin [Candidatus Woesebacteria bacterium]|nr:type II toxin-antitoxin system VapC family toxin [Candidatus Woesebacteria bacterium]